MTSSARIAAVDLNGQLRGKRVPAAKLGKEVRMPLSVLNVDIFGADIEGSPLVFDSGDRDGILKPADRGPVPMPWLAGSPDLVLCSLQRQSGAWYEGCPRHALQGIVQRYLARGLNPQSAVELEFFLVSVDGGVAHPKNPRTGLRLHGQEILSMRELDAFEGFFNDIDRGAEAMGLPPIDVSSESGMGQFEVVLGHQDALRAADDALLMKELIKGTARNHGLIATFMAKPFAEEAGNGLHMHVSIEDDADGSNIFDDGGPGGTDLLRQAVAGCLTYMPACTAIFAPHGNSYARFVDNAHAPTAATWGYENRTVAVRVPGGAPRARRLEHRVAGGDANPYLLAASVLGAMLAGIEEVMEPPVATTGNAYETQAERLAPTWGAAVEALSDPRLMRIFPKQLLENLAATKRQEIAKSDDMKGEDLTLALLDTV
ncbi:MAG: glutamine synthetase family protein [Shimia sp.]